MADAKMQVTGINVKHWSSNPCDFVTVNVAGNVEIAVGELVVLASGLATAAATAAVATDTDNFVGVAMTGHDGGNAAADIHQIVVCKNVIADVTFASAPGATTYVGANIEVSAAASHVYTFAIEAAGVDAIGWLQENGDAASTTLEVWFNSPLTSHGAQVAGTGFWQVNAAE